MSDALTDQEAIDAALDGVEQEHGVVHDDGIEVISNEPITPEVEDDPIVPEVEDPPADNPPGYMSYDEWTAAGKDPDLYKGKKAYSAEFDRIQEIKGLKGDLTSLKDSVKVITDTNQQYLQNQTDMIRSDLEAQLKAATEDNDTEAALDVQGKLHDLNTKPVQSQAPVQEHPTIAAFRESNPLLDKTNTRFNADYNDDVQNIFNNTVDRIASRDPATGHVLPLTDAKMKRALDAAKRDADKLHPHLFESQRNQRATQGKNNGKKPTAKVTTDYRTALKAVGGNSRNPNDNSPALDMYNMLLEGGNKTAAEDYAKSVLGE